MEPAACEVVVGSLPRSEAIRHDLPCSVCHGRHFRAHRPPLHRYYWRSLRTAFVRPCHQW